MKLSAALKVMITRECMKFNLSSQPGHSFPIYSDVKAKDMKKQLEVSIFVTLSICLSVSLIVRFSKCVLPTAVGEKFCIYHGSGSIYYLRRLYFSRYFIYYRPSHRKSFVTF